MSILSARKLKEPQFLHVHSSISVVANDFGYWYNIPLVAFPLLPTAMVAVSVSQKTCKFSVAQYPP